MDVYLLLILAAGLMIISADQYAENSGCPKFRYNNANSGQGISTIGMTPKIAWTYETKSNALRSSTSFGARGNTFYVGAYNGVLYAIDSKNGSSIWGLAYDGGINYCSAAVGADGTIYVGNAMGSLWAVSPEGKMKWLFLFI